MSELAVIVELMLSPILRLHIHSYTTTSRSMQSAYNIICGSTTVNTHTLQILVAGVASL
jgi:hypothetical protein